MNLKQYEKMMGILSDNIFGQKFSMVYVNDFHDSIKKEYKDLGITKVSYILGHISKKSYYEMANTSTGLEALGVNLLPKRESQYNYEKLNGFLASLKSKPDNKYLILRFDDDPARKNIDVMKVVYIDKSGNILDEKTVESYMTDSALKKKHKEYGRDAKLDISVGYRPFKWDGIAELNVTGITIKDDKLKKYVRLVKD